MITIYAEKPDVGTKIAAALDGIHLSSGKVVAFDEIDRYTKEIVAQRTHDGYFKIRYQGKETAVTWGYGHMCTLMQAKDYNPDYQSWRNIPLPFIPDTYRLMLRNGGEKQYQILKRLFSSSDLLICATDDDREGDLIFDYVYQYMQCRTPYKRSLFSSQTKEAFRDAFSSTKLVSSRERLPVVQAGRARSIGDFIVGANLTTALTLKYPSTGILSVGRVQTATLNMIVQRELEIRNFKPEDYWEICGIFTTGNGEQYIGQHEHKRFLKESEADQVIQKLSCTSTATVKSIKTEKYKKKKPHLYNLDSLQMEASRVFGFTMDQTLQLAQSLYEKGYTTYPRTDSVFLTDDMGPEMQAVIDMLFSDKYYSRYAVPQKVDASDKNYFNSKKVESHFAIVPTTKPATNITNDESKLYFLIAKSVICMVYPDALMSKTVVETDADGEVFLTKGTSIVDPGFLRVIGLPKESFIPSLKEQESVSAQFRKDTKQTTPPKRYTDATLLTAMINCGKTLEDEELKEILSKGPQNKPLGIGRPSTRAAIAETLVARGYIVRDKKTILPTDKGIQLIHCFPINDLKSPIMTAQWEKRLDDIARGNDTYDDFVQDLEDSVRKWTDEVINAPAAEGMAQFKKAAEGQTSLSCPMCGKPLRKFDWGYGCTGYREGCKFSISSIAKKKLTDTQIKNLLAGKTIQVKGMTGKNGPFDAGVYMEMDGPDKGRLKFNFDQQAKNRDKKGTSRGKSPWKKKN